MSGPARTGSRVHRTRRLAVPVVLLLGIGLLGSAPASPVSAASTGPTAAGRVAAAEPAPPVVVGEPVLDCSCGGLYIAENPDYADFIENALTWSFTATPQGADSFYRIVSSPALPEDATYADLYDGEGIASIWTEHLVPGTEYSFVVQEVAGSTVLASSAPVAYTPQRVAGPTRLEIHDAAGNTVDVFGADARGHLIAGATYTLHWTGTWAEGAVFWNGLNYRHATNGITLVEGGRATEPWTQFTVPADLAGRSALVEFAGALPGQLPLWFGTAWVPVVVPGGRAPLNLTAASATGTPRVGHLLTAKGGTSTADPARTFQWKRNGRAIVGQTRSTYRLVSADAGSRVTVTITGRKTDYATSSVTSPARAVAAYNYRLPAVTGTMLVRRRLTAAKGSWIAPGHTFGYQWLRNGRAIRSATRATYTLTRADRGTRISVRVTARRSGFPTVIATSPGRRAK